MEEILKEYKEKICKHCIHYEDKDYQECNIVEQINGQARCLNYKRKKEWK